MRALALPVFVCIFAACRGTSKPAADAPESPQSAVCAISGRPSFDAARNVPLRAAPTRVAYAEILLWAYTLAHAEFGFGEGGNGMVRARLSLPSARLAGWVPAEDVRLSSRTSIPYSSWLTITSEATGIWVGQSGSELRVRYGSPLFGVAQPLEVTIPCSGATVGPLATASPPAERLVAAYAGPLRSSPGGAALAELRVNAADRVPIWVGDRQGSSARAVLRVAGLLLTGWLDDAKLTLADNSEYIGPGSIGTTTGDSGDVRRCNAELPLFVADERGLVRVGETKACVPFVIVGQNGDHLQIGLAGTVNTQLFSARAALEASCSGAASPCPAPGLGAQRLVPNPGTVP